MEGAARVWLPRVFWVLAALFVAFIIFYVAGTGFDSGSGTSDYRPA